MKGSDVDRVFPTQCAQLVAKMILDGRIRTAKADPSPLIGCAQVIADQGYPDSEQWRAGSEFRVAALHRRHGRKGNPDNVSTIDGFQAHSRFGGLRISRPPAAFNMCVWIIVVLASAWPESS